eukprot:COSAG02_NODE_2770_length_8061_cov_7.055639_12_plen_81_part_00
MIQQSVLEFRTWVYTCTVCVGEHISEFIPAFPVILSVPALRVGEHIRLWSKASKHVRRPRNHIVVALAIQYSCTAVELYT